MRAGDVLLGLPSTGLHTNGYSLARKLLFESAGTGRTPCLPELGCTVADELLKVHRSYLKPIRALTEAGLLRGAAHITGGGITGQHPAYAAGGSGGRRSTPPPGPCRRFSSCCSGWGIFRKTITGGRSTWASA